MAADVGILPELLAAPVPGATPAGTDVRYDPDFEALKTEADKIGSLTGGEVDWDKIVELSTGILTQKSKDLVAASYLCFALFKSRGYPGLAAGLAGLRRLVEVHWEGLFPPAGRMRARTAAIQWLADRGAVAVRARLPLPDEAEAFDKVVEQVGLLDEELTAKIPGESPTFTEIKEALNEQAAQVAPAEPAPVSPPQGAPASPAPTAAPAPPPAAVTVDLSSAEGLEETFKSAVAALRSIAPALIKANLQDPAGYRVARFAAWSRVRQIPPHADGTTRIPAGQAADETSEKLAQLAARGEHAAVIQQAEALFMQSLFWFDLQRHTCKALAAMGPAYDRARQTVQQEFAALLQLFPGLADLAFDNGYPFASAETKQFIAQDVLAAPGSPGAPALSAGGAAPDDEFDDVRRQASELVRGGRASGGVALLHGAVGAAGDPRRRFQRRLALARQLSDLREPRLALAQLEVLEKEIEEHQLDRWEPALAVEVFQLALACQRLMVKSEWKGIPEAQRRVEDLYRRLARIDAAAALGIKP